MNSELTFKHIVKRALELYPEYIQSEHYENNDHELQYSFFFGFTNYIIEKIKKSKNPESDEEIKSYFEFFNQIIESTDEKLANLGVVEIIETLVQERESKLVAEKLLGKKGKKDLIEVLKYTGVK